MTTPPPPPIDLVTLAIAAGTAFLGPDAARMVGPYVVILVGALLGSAWSASRRGEETVRATSGHLLRHVGLALLLTVPGAWAASAWLGWEVNWLLGPVAALIGGIGHDWPRVGTWAAGLARYVIETLLRQRVGGAPPEPPKGDQQ
jgi:hypothetical protein